MKTLAIETSCDETAVSLLEAGGDFADGSATFRVLGNALLSQVDIHKEFGGVYPSLAKREHAKNLVPLTLKVLRDSGHYGEHQRPIEPLFLLHLRELFSHEPALLEQFLPFYSAVATPDIDAVAVTHGPGLEPALWVGINFAKALADIWDKPLIPVNHMEGHVVSSLMRRDENSSVQETRYKLFETAFPVLALLISGGHTEIVLMREWGRYEVVGRTRDDAVGEAFDKVARMLALPYPGGPEISKLAEEARRKGFTDDISFPRPMLHDDTLDFSFSGLKTAVLHYVKAAGTLDADAKMRVALAFENAAADVLLAKIEKAVNKYGAQTIVVGGGVSANSHIRNVFGKKIAGATVRFPSKELTTDNALMIAAAGYLRAKTRIPATEDLRANGNLSLA